MRYLVTIFPSKHSLMIGNNESTLEAALREGYIFPYGCRDGARGSCKGKILESSVNYGNYRENALSDSEKSSGLALFCKTKALSDLKIECREMNALRDVKSKVLPVRVQTIKLLAPDVIGIPPLLPTNERLAFSAAQYIDVSLKDG